MMNAVKAQTVKRWTVLPALLLVGLLSACDQASQLTQQVASSVVGIVGEEVKKQTDGVIDQVASEANQVLQPLGLNASHIASAVKAQTAQLAQQVLKVNGDWAQLTQYKGKFPQDIGLLTEVSPIMPELKQILGDDFNAFMKHMSAPSTLQFDRVLYVLGNKPQAGKQDSAWLLIDAENRKLEAGLIQNGEVKVFSSKGEALYRPAEVTQLIEKLSKGIAAK
ncbi:hypothetical protein HQ393_13250 [Chitinibacter bivalviorum]|uniref:Lipoprotein n=1 Tax=Chitinibacter bivalviorum TaxID=2739434 RepID=A0A7H9BKE2_9NEIS|nr:hypothetical protein [Chitinibacter bivalviorum]QLG89130.1 hypothetical protein HQ393_13250 [Chitinibacter bivalviorum]